MTNSPETNGRVLLVGLHEDAVDYAKWPDLDAETLRRSFEKTKASFKQAGGVQSTLVSDSLR